MSGSVCRKTKGRGWPGRRKRISHGRGMVQAVVISVAFLVLLDAGTVVLAYEPNPYSHRYTGQCTWYAWQRWPQIGRKPPSTGHAYKWILHARKKGYATGTRPVAGAIAVWERKVGGAGRYGHVAYVESVMAGDRFLVSEYNWPLGAGLRTREVSCRPGMYFIYPDGLLLTGGMAEWGGR